MKKLRMYFIRCAKHFPGWEIDMAESKEQFIANTKLWVSCSLDYGSIEEDLGNTFAKEMNLLAAMKS